MTPEEPLERSQWMELLAGADEATLEDWFARAGAPAFTWLKPPEPGLVMVRARAGATGERFNLGEMTVTRCALRVGEAATGIAYVAGRSPRHAELAALADGLMQIPASREALRTGLLAALASERASRRLALACEAAATRVDFLALARGDG